MYKLSIVTPEKKFYEDEVNSLIAPGSLGYLGILTDHAPLLTELVPGKLTLKDSQGKEKIFAISGGFLEVLKNNVTILADAIEPAEGIDFKKAEEALKRANERLKSRDENVDVPRAEFALTRALNRIKIFKQVIQGE
ncbi:MAG: F0F1 ATP synthase subunit epsilon [Candidatus Zixiibacteriota bacterium]